MSEFKAILLEGLFFLSEDPYPDSQGLIKAGFTNLMVQTDDGLVKSVYDTLRPFVGERVQLASHHLPNNPPDVSLWGGGSCFWEPSGQCPFGHHERPQALFNVSGEGILEYDLNHSKGSGGWWLLRPDGTRDMLPFAHALRGHRSRVAVATLMTVDQMRDSLLASGALDTVEGLGKKVTELKDLVERLDQTLKED